MKLSHYLFVAALALLTACSGTKSTTKKQPHLKYLPTAVHNTPFNMSMADFKTVHPDAKFLPANADAFRYEVIVKHEAPLENVGYYFDADAHNPLYEFILIYNSEAERDKVAKELFGAPNYKEKEWRYPSGEGYTIWAWTFKKKLIIAAVLPNTEWEGEE